jgi:hypothetical protein
MNDSGRHVHPTAWSTLSIRGPGGSPREAGASAFVATRTFTLLSTGVSPGVSPNISAFMFLSFSPLSVSDDLLIFVSLSIVFAMLFLF